MTELPGNSGVPLVNAAAGVRSYPKGTYFIWNLFLLLLFTGPPKFRVRSADAAAYGELDLATIVQLVVWLIAGVFTFYQFAKHSKQWRFTLLHALAFLVIATMGISTINSLSPALTAFKTFQVLIAFLFCWSFVQLFGIERFLHVVIVGCILLCVAVMVMWWLDPSSVVFVENTGQERLRGQAIYDVAHPALFGLVLLLTGVHALPSILKVPSALLFAVALLFSLDRIDWLALAVVIGLAALLRPAITEARLVRVCLWLSPFIAMGLLSFLTGRRDLDSLYADSERFGLWAFLVVNTLEVSPWIGTGFIAGSRLTGMEYAIPLPSGHSIYVDAISGCGFVGLIALIILVLAIVLRTVSLLSKGMDSVSFAVAALIICLVVISLVGAEIEASPFGVLFWGLISALAVYDKSSRLKVSVVQVKLGASTC